MAYYHLKRYNLTVREMHTLLREYIVNILGWTEIDSDPGAGSFGLLASAADGVVTATYPQRFTSGSGLFTAGMETKWLVTYDTTIQGNTGIYYIYNYIDANNIECIAGPQGPSFINEAPISWRVVDPTLNVGTCEYVVENNNSAQSRIFLTASTTDIYYELGPFGGWTAPGGPWTQPVTNTASLTIGTSSNWYFAGEKDPYNSHIIGWTDDGSTSKSIAHIGDIDSFHPSDDPNPSICLGGDPDMTATGFLAGLAGGQIAADNSTATAINGNFLGDDGTLTQNYFIDLEQDPINGYYTEIDIPLTCTVVGSEERRGKLKDIRICSTLLRYKEFVNVARTRMSLGNGITVPWDGSSPL